MKLSELKLKYDFNAMIEFEELGFKLDETIDSKPFSLIRALLFVGLEYREPDFTLEHAGLMLEQLLEDEEQDFKMVTEYIMDEFKKSGFFKKAKNKVKK